MKKIFNIVIICQLFFAFTLSFPTGVLAKATSAEAPLVPPVPEDIPFDHKGLDKEMYDADDKTRDAVALNTGIVLTGAVANGLLFQGGCHAPSAILAGLASVLFLIAQVVQMLEYSEAKGDALDLIKKNVTEEKKRVQEQTIDAAISDVEGMRKLARARRDAGIAYSIMLTVAGVAAGLEAIPVVAAFFTCSVMANYNYKKEKIMAFFAKAVGIESADAGTVVRLLTSLGLPVATVAAMVVAAKFKAKILFNPWTRVVTYSVLLLLQIKYITLMDEVIDTYTKRIEKFRELKSMITTSAGTRVNDGSAGPPPKADGSIGPPPTVAIRGAGPGGDDGQGCVSQSGDPDPSCKGPFMEVGPLNDRFVKLADPTTLGAINDAKKAVNAFASGKNAQGRGALANLAKNKNAVRNASRKAIDDINKKLISEKKPPINFSDEAAKIYKDSKAALLKAIANTPGASLSQMSLGVAPPLADGEKEKTEKGDTPASASGIAAIAMPDFGPGSPGPSAASEVTAAPSEKMNSEEAFKGKKLDMNDINKNKDVSIFTVLTVRYKLSAYPKFFKKLETKEAPAPSTIPAPLK